MALVSIARRYARALLAAASEEGKPDDVLAELHTLSKEIEGSADLRVLLDSPAFNRAQRRQVLDALAQAHGFSQLTRNFLRLLLDRKRTTHLPMIVRLYRDMADALAGRVRAEVVTPTALPAEQAARLGKALEAVTGKRIELTRRQDPSLLGGVVAQVGDRIFDGSLKTQLRQLRDAALSG